MMGEIVKDVVNAPLATIFVIAGMIFLFVAAVGNISGKVEPGSRGRIISGILGAAFVIVGIILYSQQTPRMPSSSDTTPATERASASRTIPEQRGAGQTLPATVATPQTPHIENNHATPAATTPRVEKGAGNEITSAYKVALGETIMGRMSKAQDRVFYTFKTADHPTGTIRVILRKRFGASVTIYNAVERNIRWGWQFNEDPVTLSFDSAPNSTYYIMVERKDENWGGYELVVREE
ncbi:hypothetical protein [Burkholderia ubonensis]|uniref:hypothetical protein n=2 Tax=Burkholderia ubonensis TaxID=101571 RepID=UPI0012F88FF7|nr:hypothetical protein [Burkholderia ubonensis]